MATDAATPSVREFMTPDLCTADAGLSINDALQRMTLNHIRHLAVVRHGKVIGVVSSRDLALVAGLQGVDASKAEVAGAVTGPAQACAPDAPLAEVAAAMESNRYGSVVVVEDDVAIGIFTTTDALRALRQIITGRPAERLNPPTHVVEHDADANRSGHFVHLLDRVRLGRGLPSPNDGKIGGSPI